MPRLYREAPLNSLWEGAGNVNALDVLRALTREPATLETYFAEVDGAASDEPRLAAFSTLLRGELAETHDREARARRLVESMALGLQAAVVVRASPGFVADAFVASRLTGNWGHAFGTLEPGSNLAAIVERAHPGAA